MRQKTLIKDGRFVTGWHFDSRDDFLQNRLLLPSPLREEYESQFPPPPPSSPPSPSTTPPPPSPPQQQQQPPTSQPVMILRVPQSGRLYHICPPTHPQMVRKQWAALLQRRKIFLRGEAWMGLTMCELAGICARRVGPLEGWSVGVGEISLGFCGVKVGGEITVGELIDFARVRLEEPDEGVWECPVFLEVGIHRAAATVVGGDERSRKKRRKEEETIQLPSPVATPSSGTIAGYLGLAREERYGG